MISIWELLSPTLNNFSGTTFNYAPLEAVKGRILLFRPWLPFLVGLVLSKNHPGLSLLLFDLYTSLRFLLAQHSIRYNLYVDDTQILINFDLSST